jgi:hypothetical protein
LTDFWHHLVRGRTIVAENDLLTPDLSTFTVPVRNFQNANWGSQILYFHLYNLGGLTAVQIMNALVLAGMMGMLVYLCRRVSGSMGVAAIVCVFSFFGLWQVFTIRPQTFSLFLFVLLYLILELSETRPWLLIWPPVISVLWVNLHGAFPVGILLTGAWMLASVWEGWRERDWKVFRDRRVLLLSASLGFSLLALFINPFGWNIIGYVGTTVSSAAGRGIEEWVPPNTAMFIGKIWVVSLLLVVVGFSLAKVRPTVREVCLVLCFLPLACSSVRMVAWWMIIIAPILAARLSSLVSRRQNTLAGEPPAFGAAVFVGLIVLMAIFSVPGLNRFNPLMGPTRRSASRTQADLEAISECLSSQCPSGRIFSRFEWGEYLSWELGPRYQVFMDGWIEMFPDEVWAEYASVTTGRSNWEQILDRYQVDYLLLDQTYHRDTGLLAHVEQSLFWERCFEAGDALLFVRNEKKPL